MVFFSQISSAIAGNKEASFQVPTFSLKQEEDIVLSTSTKTTMPVAKPTVHVETVPVPVTKSSVLVETVPLPVPVTKSSVLVETVPLPVPVKTIEKAVVPKTLPTSQDVKSVTKKPTHGMDPISIGMAARDPMYEIATKQVKQTLEAEEAQRLEGLLDSLYKSESGRSRGWVKTHLTTFLLPRAASGSFVSAKEVFSWEQVRTDKQTSAILDFVCLAKGIRIAIWYPESKETYIWPAADKGSETPPLLHFSPSGAPIRKDSVFEDGWTLRPPVSFDHSLEKLTISELGTLAQKVGIPEPSGKKTDYIRAIGTARTKLRFV
jgi:hypothetical protein